MGLASERNLSSYAALLGVSENMKPVVLRYCEAAVWKSELPLTATNYTLLKLCGVIISNLFEALDQLWKAIFFPFHFNLIK